MNINSDPIVWPKLEEELAPYLKYIHGIVLNAGSGQREIQLGKRDLNIDIVPSNKPDILGDLHALPLQDNAVDTIVSIAVLEHTRYPWIVAKEFHRVLRTGGYGVIAVPFLQPQHACPHDYVRFTEQGLVELMKYVGFDVIETGHVHHFGQTLAWQIWEYLKGSKTNKWTLPFWWVVVNQLSKGNFFKGNSETTHNTHYVIVHKPGEIVDSTAVDDKLLNNADPNNWFYPLLICPETIQPLQLTDDRLVSQDGRFAYDIADNIPNLLPKSHS
ncbi:methyltransferase domain-containing protein [Chamaesiphon sp. VAR_69_metabat_338]|uniref:methyltransferase domain-containing protein n=1 Tax=Chamaesiphon sp. VAR_69_metabat_338 TaxID=2964704 RepID=UPI00286D9216|nr:methyltransferase domain-containing protein [Chamaesiphon sp. VAR_69_metabat_338]